jgi:hypothetical protein
VKVVIYGEDNKVIESIENIKSPEVDGNTVTWEDGSLGGINLPFLLLEDPIAVGEHVTEEVISQDKKSQFPKIDLAKENAELKSRQDLMQNALDDLILGGMV